MKKFMIFAVTMLMSMTASYAVEFGFAEVSETKQVGNGFFAYTAGGEAVGISALQYSQMKDATGYYIVNVDGKKVVAAGDDFVVEPLTVDSVGLSNGKPQVFFKGGTSKVFANEGWLKVLKGQVVRRAYLNVPTWEWENYATVDEGQVVVYHSKVAPVKKATVASTATATTTVVPPAKVEPIGNAQSTNNANPGITFSVRKH